MASGQQALRDSFARLKQTQPRLRARDAAEKLGVSEGALTEARAQSDEVARLAPSGAECFQVIEALQQVGRVMTLTRNRTCVHEIYGEIGEAKSFGKMAQVVGSIDLRLMFHHWRRGYAVTEETRSGLRRSLQFFDSVGDAILKVYATDETDGSFWDRVIETHRSGDDAFIAFDPELATAAECDDASIDLEALRSGWSALEHTHDFHSLLKNVGVGRLQALRLVGEPFAAELPRATVVEALEQAAEAAVPVMAFVGNRGCIQIFSGPIFDVSERGSWINVMDPDFHMHLRLDQVASVWRVLRPTTLRGDITSLELFDAAGDLVLQLFGARPPGESENPRWRALIGELRE